MGTQLESCPRYSPTTCFGTFPFLEPAAAQLAATSGAAARLNQLREGWLNPPNATALELKKCTNQRHNQRDSQRVTWLTNIHAALAAAVAAAHGWPDGLNDAGILERLLTLNLEWAAEPANGYARARTYNPDHRRRRPDHGAHRGGEPGHR